MVFAWAFWGRVDGWLMRMIVVFDIFLIQMGRQSCRFDLIISLSLQPILFLLIHIFALTYASHPLLSCVQTLLFDSYGLFHLHVHNLCFVRNLSLLISSLLLNLNFGSISFVSNSRQFCLRQAKHPLVRVQCLLLDFFRMGWPGVEHLQCIEVFKLIDKRFPVFEYSPLRYHLAGYRLCAL